MAYTFDVTTWMPTAMTADEKAAWAAAYPLDPHRAAAMAWEAWAAALVAESDSSVATSVSTGVQSITYGEAISAAGHARAKAAWHWARCRTAAVRSPDFPVATPVDRMVPPTWVDYVSEVP